MFGYLRTRYDGIDFGELEAEITSEEDRYFVEPLLKTRDLLPRLGRAIHAVVATPSRETYEQLRLIIHQLQDADHPEYRHRIAELEQKLKSQPAPV
jgi:hypothetical protein